MRVLLLGSLALACWGPLQQPVQQVIREVQDAGSCTRHAVADSFHELQRPGTLQRLQDRLASCR